MTEREGEKKKFSRRQILGFGLTAGIGIPLNIYLYKQRQEKDHSQFNFPEGDPFENGEEVNVDLLTTAEYGGKVVKSTLDFPVIDLSSPEKFDISNSISKLEELSISTFGLFQNKNIRGFNLTLDFGEGVYLGDKFKSGNIIPPAFGIAYNDDVLEKNIKKDFNVEFLKSSEIEASSNIPDLFSEITDIAITFPYKLEYFSNKNIVFFFNKGLTNKIDKPTFLPFKFKVPDLTQNPKKALANFNFEFTT